LRKIKDHENQHEINFDITNSQLCSYCNSHFDGQRNISFLPGRFPGGYNRGNGDSRLYRIHLPFAMHAMAFFNSVAAN
jgi:hypothetical protein